MTPGDETQPDALAKVSQARHQHLLGQLDRTDDPQGKAQGHVSRGYWDQTVLVIDDAEEIHDLIAVRLRPEAVTLHRALDAETGLAEALACHPDLILLDLDLGGVSGIDVCRQLKSHQALDGVPVIFLTGTTDVATKERAFDAGASDYVTKPFDAVELRARVRSALRMKRIQDYLATRSQLDGQTGLWNRTYFDLRLNEAVAATNLHGHRLAVVLLAIDQFREINEVHGVPAGDRLLRQVAEALVAGLTPCDTACRISGDEFALILPEASLESAGTVAERLRARMEDLALVVGGRPVAFTASFGLAAVERLRQHDDWSAVDLVDGARAALREARRAGGNQVRRQTP